MDHNQIQSAPQAANMARTAGAHRQMFTAKKHTKVVPKKTTKPPPSTTSPQEKETRTRTTRPGFTARKRLIQLAAGRGQLKTHITMVSMRKILRDGYDGRVSRACVTRMVEYARHFVQHLTAKATQYAALMGRVRVTDELIRFAAHELGEQGFFPCVAGKFPHAGSDIVQFPDKGRLPSLFRALELPPAGE